MSACQDCHSHFCNGDCVKTEDEWQSMVDERDAEIERLRTEYGVLSHDLAQQDVELKRLRAENEHLRDDILKQNYSERLLLAEQERDRLRTELEEARSGYHGRLKTSLKEEIASLREALERIVRLKYPLTDAAEIARAALGETK